jgi:hypothetical protein
MEKSQLYLLPIKTLSGMSFVPAERSKPVYFDRVLEPFRLAISTSYPPSPLLLPLYIKAQKHHQPVEAYVIFSMIHFSEY